MLILIHTNSYKIKEILVDKLCRYRVGNRMKVVDLNEEPDRMHVYEKIQVIRDKSKIEGVDITVAVLCGRIRKKENIDAFELLSDYYFYIYTDKDRYGVIPSKSYKILGDVTEQEVSIGLFEGGLQRFFRSNLLEYNKNNELISIKIGSQETSKVTIKDIKNDNRKKVFIGHKKLKESDYVYTGALHMKKDAFNEIYREMKEGEMLSVSFRGAGDFSWLSRVVSEGGMIIISERCLCKGHKKLRGLNICYLLVEKSGVDVGVERLKLNYLKRSVIIIGGAGSGKSSYVKSDYYKVMGFRVYEPYERECDEMWERRKELIFLLYSIICRVMRKIKYKGLLSDFRDELRFCLIEKEELSIVRIRNVLEKYDINDLIKKLEREVNSDDIDNFKKLTLKWGRALSPMWKEDLKDVNENNAWKVRIFVHNSAEGEFFGGANACILHNAQKMIMSKSKYDLVNDCIGRSLVRIFEENYDKMDSRIVNDEYLEHFKGNLLTEPTKDRVFFYNCFCDVIYNILNRNLTWENLLVYDLKQSGENSEVVLLVND